MSNQNDNSSRAAVPPVPIPRGETLQKQRTDDSIGDSLQAEPECKAWMDADADEAPVLCLSSHGGQQPVRVPIGEVVGLDLHLNGDKTTDEWTGYLLVARRVPRLVTYESSVALVLHSLLFLTLFIVTFDAVGPLTATIFSGYFAWHVYQTQLPVLENPPTEEGSPTKAGPNETTLPPLLFWWADWALLWMALVRLPGSSVWGWCLRAVGAATIVGLLCGVHSSSPTQLPKTLLARWLQGSIFFVDVGLGKVTTRDWWPQASRPVVVHFGPSELPDLINLRSSLLAAGHSDLLQHVWVGNYHVEMILSAVLPTTWYNSRTTRKALHIIVNLGLPLFFCFQATHIVIASLLSLNLPMRWQTDPVVRLCHLVDDGLHWLIQRPRFGASGSQTILGRAIGFVLGGLGRGTMAILDWLAAVAMPVDYFLTYVQARLNSLKNALAPILWALHPAWLFLQQRIFWGVPGFASFGWWKRAINAANHARTAVQKPKTPSSSPLSSPRKPDSSEGSARRRPAQAEPEAREG